MNFEAELVAQLRRDEGERLSAYKDSLGYLTIGVGRLIDPRKGGGISREESSYLLSNDIQKCLDALDERIPWYRAFEPARQGVLVNMAFQLGVDGLLRFENTLQAIKDRRFEDASFGMLASLWARQTPERAMRLADQMRDGQWR